MKVPKIGTSSVKPVMQSVIYLKASQSAMGLHWPGLYFCQFEKRLPQPEIKSTRPIHLEIHFNPT